MENLGRELASFLTRPLAKDTLNGWWILPKPWSKGDTPRRLSTTRVATAYPSKKKAPCFIPGSSSYSFCKPANAASFFRCLKGRFHGRFNLGLVPKKQSL